MSTISSTNNMKKPFMPRFTLKEQDTNTMDVDRLSTNERTEHVAKSQWFKHHEKENLARNSEEQILNQNFGQYKKTAKIVLAQIRNIVAGMDPEEKDRIYEDVFEENSIVTMDTLRISSVIMTNSKMRSMHISIPIIIKMNHARQITHFTWIQAKIDKRKLLEKLCITDLGSSDVIFGLPWFKENNPQIVWKTGRVQLPKADLDTTFLYLAKDKQRRKEINEEPKEFQRELSQQSSSKKTRTESESTFLGKKKNRRNHETK
jgi:hypothetical protein